MRVVDRVVAVAAVNDDLELVDAVGQFRDWLGRTRVAVAEA